MRAREDAPQILRDFLTYIVTIKGKSQKTADEYYLDLRMFFRYLKRTRKLAPPDLSFEQIPISDVELALIKTVTLSDIYEFLDFLANRRITPQGKTGVKAAGRARKVATLRSFFKYLTNKAQLISENPARDLDSPKIKRSLPRYLTLEQSRALLSSVGGANGTRDLCILTLFLNCGLRVSELAGINLNDIVDDTLRVTGKGNKERMVYLGPACLETISRWKTVRSTLEVLPEYKNALFISRNRRRLSPEMIKLLVKTHLLQAGLDYIRFSAHKLRHTAATLMYQNGVDILTLQEILGHEQINTTRIYAHVQDEKIREAARLNPLANISTKVTLP